MTLKFKCKNNHITEIQEYLFMEEPQKYLVCHCGEWLELVNIKEVVIDDLHIQVKNNLNRWFREMGIEGTIEMLERNRHWLPEKVIKLYDDELERRGLK